MCTLCLGIIYVGYKYIQRSGFFYKSYFKNLTINNQTYRHKVKVKHSDENLGLEYKRELKLENHKGSNYSQ